MFEHEIKFYCPHAAMQAINEHILASPSAQTVPLRALYFDTRDAQLAQQKIAIRLRLEPEGWMQTLKMPSQHDFSRLELNHRRPEPSVDLSVYEQDEVVRALQTIDSEALQVVYETDVQRCKYLHKLPDATIEIAFDQGEIKAADTHLAVCEVEFELLDGAMQSLYKISQEWAQRHELLLDLRSKAHRGHELASFAAKHTVHTIYNCEEFWQVPSSATANDHFSQLINTCCTQLVMVAELLDNYPQASFIEPMWQQATASLQHLLDRLTSETDLNPDTQAKAQQVQTILNCLQADACAPSVQLVQLEDSPLQALFLDILAAQA
ncbi:CYTH domain-containing protein [Brackiella oedipodis]|uniref:CYTH domain-containing protein n=1 Tax=Brackiella oedipodis TaxID=124225 RepID=UPI00048FC2A3|nr:CYTH domain-containing protein [Brackiella oedipodis]